MSARLLPTEHADRTQTETSDFECAVCRLRLWNPVARLRRSWMGLYDDARFPGRCILMLDVHREDLAELEPNLLEEFMRDTQLAAKIIREVTGADRLNFAILGNAEPHIHVHLIPRFFAEETYPKQSPWDDPRPQSALEEDQRTSLIEALRVALKNRL